MERVSYCVHEQARERDIVNLAKDNMLAIEPGSGNGGDKELAAVGIWA
jgi:hypothetical protein